MDIALEGTIEIVRSNIRMVRTRLGKTALQFAKMVNVGSSTIANFETGGLESISERTISRIALGVGLAYEDLIDPTLKDRYRPNAAKPTAPAVDDDPLTAEFNKLRKRMGEKAVEETIAYMRFLLWKRDNP